MLTLIFMMLLTPWIRLGMLVVTANPIPWPAIWMPEEYINATISPISGVLWAWVNGTYPFGNSGYDIVYMKYPVPPKAYNISVKMNEASLDWSYSDESYSTVIGDFPMINWTIHPAPGKFTIRTFYEHPVPLIDGNYTFLYAMGTGRYLRYYAKETTAYVTVSISKDVAYTEGDINVYTIGYYPTTEEWIWKPANYTIAQKDETWIVTLTVFSGKFYPLVEDLLITIRAINPPPPTIVATVDVRPDELNLKSKGKWITAYIKLPEGYNVGDINVFTILLNDRVPAESSKVRGEMLTVRFDRSRVIALLGQTGEVELTVTGFLSDVTPFEGSDTIIV